MPETETAQPTLSEQLTANFYQWEIRGRGWQIWDVPVELEPPFRPFYHWAPLPQAEDDGRRHTLSSFLIDKAQQFFNKEAPALPQPEPIEEPSPRVFDDRSDLKEIEIALLPSEKVVTENIQQLLLNLSYSSLPLSFEIIGTHDCISLQLTCREPDYLQVRQQLLAYFPEAVINERDYYLADLWDIQKQTVVVDFGLSQEFMRPLRTYRNFDTDPLIGIIGALENLERDEVGLLQILFQGTHQPWLESILRSVMDPDGRPFFADAPDMLPLAKEKIQKPLFSAAIRVAGQSMFSERAWRIVKNLGSGLKLVSNPHSNELIPLTNDDYYHEAHPNNDLLQRQSRRSGMLLNSEELTALVHLPSFSVRSAKLKRQLTKTKAAPAITQSGDLYLGDNHHQGKTTTVSLSQKQRLRHTYVVGATGTGKSTLILNMIIQDIEQGHGVGVLDPHGELIEKILGYIPESRHEDVILLDPAASEYPIGFNILTSRSELEKTILSSDLVSVFRRLSTSWGDQMTAVLGNAILAFLESDAGGTLLELRRFLVEVSYRNDFLKTVKDPEVVYYWQKAFPMLTSKPQASVLTRLDTFLRPKLIRNMVVQKKGLDFHGILNTKKIFLAKLSQGLIGEDNSYLLGTLIVSALHQAAMARQAMAAEQRNIFYLYIDEFQNFITPSMAAILSGARKYHLGLVLAHQELRQLWNQDTEVANSVISNPYTRISFRLGDFDAKKLEGGFSYFDARDLQNLGIGEALARVERSDFDFSLQTHLPPEISPEVARERQERLTALSRTKYAVLRTDVESAIQVERDTDEPPTEKRQPDRPITPKQDAPSKPKPAKRDEKIKSKPVAEEQDDLSGVGGREHRYLQTLIKKAAEKYGFRAVIEEPTLDGQGKVDVGLHIGNKRIGCEVSLTTTPAQEIENIKKCLAAGYDQVVLCSPKIKRLKATEDLTAKQLKKAERKKLRFFQPEQLLQHLNELAAKEASSDKRVKGYRVKVEYKAQGEGEKDEKREAIANVIMQAMKRMK